MRNVLYFFICLLFLVMFCLSAVHIGNLKSYLSFVLFFVYTLYNDLLLVLLKLQLCCH